MKIHNLILIGIISMCALSGCKTPTQQAQDQNARTNAALAKQKKATAVAQGKEADLNRAAEYAYVKLNNPVLGSKILDAQLTLTGPQVTREDLLEQQVRDLQAQNASLAADKSVLLGNVAEIKAAKAAADQVAEEEIQKGQDLTLKLAVKADQEQKDESWGGLYGLFRYALKSFWTLVWVALGAVVLILAIRFGSIWVPELGLLLTAIEHGFAFIFSMFARLVPGAISAAGWVVKEVEGAFAPKAPASTPAPAVSPPSGASP